jgi:hypothetical protein
MSLLVALLAIQVPMGLPDNARNIPARQVRALVADYGDCIVKREAARASAAILAGLNSNELLDRYPQLMQESCLHNRLGERVEVRFSGDQYRFAIADALVRRELAAVPPPVLDDVASLDHHGPAGPPTSDAKDRPLEGRALELAMRDYEVDRAAHYLWRYGECVVRVDPAAAKAMLMTDPASPEEGVRFAAMSNALGTCLGEGRTLEFGKAALRGTIAVNYYRLAKTPRAAVAVQAKGAAQ